MKMMMAKAGKIFFYVVKRNDLHPGRFQSPGLGWGWGRWVKDMMAEHQHASSVKRTVSAVAGRVPTWGQQEQAAGQHL